MSSRYHNLSILRVCATDNFPWIWLILSHQDGWKDFEQIPGGTDDFKDIQRNLSKPNAKTLRRRRQL